MRNGFSSLAMAGGMIAKAMFAPAPGVRELGLGLGLGLEC